MFKLLLVLASISVAIFLLLPLLKRSLKQDSSTREEVNLQSAATRLAELTQELKNNEITQKEFEQFKLDIENAAVDDLRNATSIESMSSKGNILLGVCILLLLPIASIVLYGQLGEQKALLSQQQLLDQTLSEAERKILTNPEDVEGRIALAQVYTELKRYSDAESMYQQLLELRPNNPNILVAYAEFSALKNNNQLSGAPFELINRALEISPNHQRALWLAGFAEIQSDNKAQALEYWQKLLSLLDVNSEMYQQIQNLIADVKNKSESVNNISLKVSVSIKQNFISNLKPDSTLFVFAKAANGPPIPLAVYRGSVSELPLTVTLDDSMAMVPDMSLSRFDHVIIGARVSSNGQPQGQIGDLEGFSSLINLRDTQVVDVIIDSLKAK